MANKIAPNEVWNLNGETAGGLASEEDTYAARQNSAAFQVRPPRGVFAAFPGATPKYAINKGEQEKDFRETMARMFLQVPNYANLIAEFNNDPELQQIAAVVAGTANDDGSTLGGAGYVDFLLQSAAHSFQEKAQVVEVLADDHVAYFFGQAATTFSYSGTLLNTKQDDQALNMLRLYAGLGRGSQLASRKTLISLRYDGVFVSGAMMNFTYTLNAETEMMVPFSFNLLVKSYQIIPNPYSGLVTLTTPFAVKGQGYAPFSQGSLDPGTKPTSPAATPSAVTTAAIKPAASEGSATSAEKAKDEKGWQISNKLYSQVTTTVVQDIAAKLGN
jgi:hypothetical protein